MDKYSTYKCKKNEKRERERDRAQVNKVAHAHTCSRAAKLYFGRVGQVIDDAAE